MLPDKIRKPHHIAQPYTIPQKREHQVGSANTNIRVMADMDDARESPCTIHLKSVFQRLCFFLLSGE